MEDAEDDDRLVDGERDPPIPDAEPIHGLPRVRVEPFDVEPG